jgi:flagellar hook-basal body complex protein FliE
MTMIDPVSIAARRVHLDALQNGGLGSGSAGGASPGGTTFGDTLKQAIEKVSEAQDSSRANVSAFLRGEHVELHQMMAASEEAGIALEMLIEVRNKFTEAYRTVINMQS